MQFAPLGSSPFLEPELTDLCHLHLIIRRGDIPKLQSTLRTLKSKKRHAYKQVRVALHDHVKVERIAVHSAHRARLDHLRKTEGRGHARFCLARDVGGEVLPRPSSA